MQLLKGFVVLIILSISMSVTADKESTHIKVNFYTLASIQPELDGKKIEIRGWIAFYDYGDSQKVLLFPSKESRGAFNVHESIGIDIAEQDFAAARQYLSDNFVTVYGIYKLNNLDNWKLFGSITEINDIDIVRIN